MKCPKCGIEMRIASADTRVVGDESANEDTIVESVQTLVCRNKNCPGYGQVGGESRVELFRRKANAAES